MKTKKENRPAHPLTKSTKYKRLYCSAYEYKNKSYAMKEFSNLAGTTILPEGKVRKKNGQWIHTTLLTDWEVAA